MNLTQDQQAVATAFTSFLLDDTKQYLVIKGYAGRGKTFLTKYLIETARAQKKFLRKLTGFDDELNIELSATTHKAAHVLEKSTGIPTSTIHHLLKLIVKNDYKTGTSRLVRRPDATVIENTLIFIDEASMIDSELLNVIQQSTMKCKIVFIMDPKQLLPLYHNDCPVSLAGFETHELNEVVRQAKDNPIVSLASELCEQIGSSKPVMPAITSSPEIQVVDGPQFKDIIETDYVNRNPKDIRILAWTNNRVNQYIAHMQQFLYPDQPLFNSGAYYISNKPLLNDTQDILIPNEATVQIIRVHLHKNHVHISDHQSLECYSIDLRYDNNTYTVNQPVSFGEMTALLKQAKKAKDWSTFFMLQNQFADLRPIYSSTVHKAQGSTFETVYVDLDDLLSNNKMDEALRLLYVAITRASQNVILLRR